ncbi:T9SS type A sorting domain-containing protein, partial [Candidatus Poribacteria bacterium]|nr:T9SS type A sorting domain-containing protein [Candidatus Poribacteria bacterium]
AVLPISLKGIGIPKQSLELQNYPNPFTPETWIPYRLSESASVTLSIYDITGGLVRTISLGFKSAGFYQDRSRAAYWNGLNDVGERVSSGVYFYRLSTSSFDQMRRMIILK